jgi:hypothetical protein
MSNWNPLELRKWKPRQPSPELRARIFCTEPEVVPSAAFDLRELTRWLVPAFGCFMLVMASLSTHLQPHYGMELAATNFVLPSLEEEGAAAMVPPTSTKHSMMNCIPAKTFEWTFAQASSATSVSTLLISYTNKLIK